MLVKPKPGKSDGNLLIFITSHPFAVHLFFLKHPVWNVNVASSWTRHSWIPVPSCQSEGGHTILMQIIVNTFPLEITWCLCYDRQSVFMSPRLFIIPFSLMDTSNIWQTTCLTLFIQFPVDPGVAFSFWCNNETESSNIV